MKGERGHVTRGGGGGEHLGTYHKGLMGHSSDFDSYPGSKGKPWKDFHNQYD